MIPFVLQPPADFRLTASQANRIAEHLREAQATGQPVVVPADWSVFPNAGGLVARMRHLHRRSGSSCVTCPQPYPCETSQALDVFAPMSRETAPTLGDGDGEVSQ